MTRISNRCEGGIYRYEAGGKETDQGNDENVFRGVAQEWEDRESDCLTNKGNEQNPLSMSSPI